MSGVRQRIPIMAAPVAPKCFAARDIWIGYLQSAQDANKPSARPFEDNQYRPTFNFCCDCPKAHMVEMQRYGNCDRAGYVAAALEEQGICVKGAEHA